MLYALCDRHTCNENLFWISKILVERKNEIPKILICRIFIQSFTIMC
jgi:hypothetical protein